MIIKHFTITTILVLSLHSPVLAQTSLTGTTDDKATSWSFNDAEAQKDFQFSNPNATIAISSETGAVSDTEPDIDATLAAESRYRVQLSVSNDQAAMQKLQDDVARQHPELFASHVMITENTDSGYRLLVTGFATKGAASDWCTVYMVESGSDCLALDAEARVSRDARLAQIAGMITDNMTSSPEEFVRGDSGMPFHQFQRAWEKADQSAGVFEARYCPTCSYKMNLRELMVSTFEVPKGETITAFDLGDGTLFDAQRRTKSSLAIMAKAFGTDTNLNIYTDSGRTYPVYLRALDVQSKLLPDILFRVVDPSLQYTEVTPPETLHEVADLIDAPAKINKLALLNALKPAEMTEADFVREIPFDAGKITFQGFKISGSPDMKLKPDIVFRDDAFIFLYYAEPNTVPAFESYSVVDDYDELLGTTIHGRLYAIKALVPLVSLKSGNSYLCIEIDL